MHTGSAEFEWDLRKARSNLRKHGVRFADAASVFEDPRAVTARDERSGELRFVTVGEDSLGRHLVVAYVWRGEVVRIIPARRATARERREHEG